MKHTLKVAVVGSGTMGNGIAQTFAMQGHSVALADISKDGLDNALNTIRGSLDRFVAKEKMTTEQAAEIGDRIHPICNDLEAAVADVDVAADVDGNTSSASTASCTTSGVGKKVWTFAFPSPATTST